MMCLITILYRIGMIRKYDYLEEKEDEECYNFLQDSFEYNQDFDFAQQHEQARRKSRSMHVTIDADEGIRYQRQTKFRSRKNNFSKYIQQSNSKEQEMDNATRRSNFIYHKTIDRFKEQIYQIRIKQGIQQIALNSKIPKLIPSLSSNKKISSISEKQACAMERGLKNRLQLAQKLKTIAKRKPPISSQPVGSLKEAVRQTLDRRINDINKIVMEDAGSINLRIQEMDPINQMHRIRMIMEKGHRELQLVGEENGGIEQNIYEVRQLMRKYLKEE